jgi:hypothetical protein
VELAARAITKIEQDRTVLARNTTLGLVVAGCVFALSYANGGFDDTTKAYAGISAWWLLGSGAAIGIAAARTRVDRVAVGALGLLAAFAIWTLISISWAPDGGRAFAQFDQVSLYVAALALAIVMARLVPSSVILAGVALAISAIAAVALISRVFPSSFDITPSTALPSLTNRLNFPIGYWNGLGIELALAYPLLLSIMTSPRSRLTRALAAVPLPILAADMYLTSSRGAFVAAGIAVLAYLFLAPDRWPALAAAALACAAGAVAVAVLVHKSALTLGLMTNPGAVYQGHRAAAEIAIGCVLTSLVWVGLAALGRRLPPPPRIAGWAVTGVIGVAVVVAIALSHPIAKFDAFRGNKAVYGGASLIQQHLLSSSGSGRWQFWTVASSEFQAHPLNGGGAGSWVFWWHQHSPLPGIVSETAHSLYLESLAELGIVGLLLISGAVVLAVVGAVRSALALQSREVAAAAASGIAFFAAAAYDWVWSLSGIAIVGLGLLGVALGARSSTRAFEWGRFGVVRPLLALLAVAAIVPQVVVLASEIHVQKSQAAVQAGDGARARREALAAKAVEPWNTDAYIQLALVDERLAKYEDARSVLAAGIRRSALDWRLWYHAVRIDLALGRLGAAKRDLAQTRRLWPGNPTLTTLQSGS